MSGGYLNDGLDARGNIPRDPSAVELIDGLIRRAIATRASDIHIEPFESKTLVRMRVDGIMLPCAQFPQNIHQSLISRIKVMSNLDITERRLPQDGHCHVRLEESGMNDADIRVSILPTVFGEKAVLRLLTASMEIDYSGQFGMDGESYRRFLPMLDRTGGLIYLTGPTGSGKSTTLYMILEYLARRPINIVTVEDPVERRIPGVNQMQVSPSIGLTFDTGLRALLRQDPDIIMVGETRDKETASISVRAAITGHLVLSTLHTNNAVSSIVRLADMGVDRFLMANSLVCLTAQRLVRKICPYCARGVTLTEQERRSLGGGIVRVKRGVGCPRCGGTGYKGRIAVHEILVADQDVRRMIARGAKVWEIETYAREELGMKTLSEKGLELVRQGITTPEEYFRRCFIF